MDPACGSSELRTGVKAADRTRAIATAPSTADNTARKSTHVGAGKVGWLGLNIEWAQARREGLVTCRRGQGHQERRKAVRTMTSSRTAITLTPQGKLPEPMTPLTVPALVLAKEESDFEPTVGSHHQDVATFTDAEPDRLHTPPLILTEHPAAYEPAAQRELKSMHEWEGEERLTQRVEAVRDRLLGDRNLINGGSFTGSSTRTKEVSGPVQTIELAVLGVGTLLWEACGRWDEGSLENREHVDRLGELWKVSAAGGSTGATIRLAAGPRTEARHQWIRSQMTHLKRQQFDETQKVWWQREVVRLETFLQFAKLGGAGWSVTQQWNSHSGAGSGMLDRLLRTRDRLRRAEHLDHRTSRRTVLDTGGSAHWVIQMKQAFQVGTVAEIFTGSLHTSDRSATRRSPLQLYDPEGGTIALNKEFRNHIRGKEFGVRWDTGTQTDNIPTEGTDHHNTKRIAALGRLRRNSTTTAQKLSTHAGATYNHQHRNISPFSTHTDLANNHQHKDASPFSTNTGSANIKHHSDTSLPSTHTVAADIGHHRDASLLGTHTGTAHNHQHMDSSLLSTHTGAADIRQHSDTIQLSTLTGAAVSHQHKDTSQRTHIGPADIGRHKDTPQLSTHTGASQSGSPAAVVIEWRHANEHQELKEQIKLLEEQAKEVADWYQTRDSRLKEASSQTELTQTNTPAQEALHRLSERSAPQAQPSKPSYQSVPSWAAVAENKSTAVWDLRFEDRLPLLGGNSTVRAIRESIAGSSNFTEQIMDLGILRYDYKEPWPQHFITTSKGNTSDGKTEWRQAWLRRELRGLTVRDTGEVMIRGLHKFFNIGQLTETKLQALRKLQIDTVTEKLDGQMICGVLVGTVVQFWSRKGFTEVGKAAGRLAMVSHGSYDGLVTALASRGCTAIFEFVGRQSKIRADEGDAARLVLLAVREHSTGRYWAHTLMQQIGKEYKVETVRRLLGLEKLSIDQLRLEVQGWWDREGVIIRFTNGLWVKAKSNWWFRAGFGERLSHDAHEQHELEISRRQKLEGKSQLLEQRIAVVGWPPLTSMQDVRFTFSTAARAEMVYNLGGKLRVVIVSYSATRERDAAMQKPTYTNGNKLKLCEAYSRRARTRGSVRTITSVFK
jgi:hypothetical protein